MGEIVKGLSFGVNLLNSLLFLCDGMVEMIDKEKIKNICKESGALLVGISSADTFSQAPHGFRPTDILSTCKSVLVLCIEFPKDSFESSINYTSTKNHLMAKMDEITIEVSEKITEMGFDSIAIESSKAQLADGRYRGRLSLKHAAVLAGLGKMGSNTLVVNKKYGNMIWLGAVLTSIPFESDTPADFELNCNKCNACIKNCPVSALGETLMKQTACAKYAFINDDKQGRYEVLCWKCRQSCPNKFGVRDS
jgi:epoxyqueuosine reductase QueG